MGIEEAAARRTGLACNCLARVRSQNNTRLPGLGLRHAPENRFIKGPRHRTSTVPFETHSE